MAAARLARDLTQAQLAQQAGLSKRTVERMEAGEVATQLSSLIRVCRVLEFLDRFDQVIPEASTSPMSQLKRRAPTRQRASGSRHVAAAPRKKWAWAES